MDAKQSKEPTSISIEVRLDPVGSSYEELDSHTRRLASELRQLPHISVGIVGSQMPDIDGSETRATEGVVTMSLDTTTLPQVVGLLGKFFKQESRQSIKLRLKGPTGVVLDFADANFNEASEAWLTATIKQSSNASVYMANSAETKSNPISSVEEIRDRARRHIESGAVTVEYGADQAQVVKFLNELLASELICFLRYKSNYYRAVGVEASAVKSEFREHALETQQHMDRVARRIVELGGSPDFNPEGLASRGRSEFKLATTLAGMIKENLVAERIAVEFYSELIHWLGDSDLTTRKMLQDILEVEAQHAEDMKRLLVRYRGI
jgi:bacterioferritin